MHVLCLIYEIIKIKTDNSHIELKYLLEILCINIVYSQLYFQRILKIRKEISQSLDVQMKPHVTSQTNF